MNFFHRCVARVLIVCMMAIGMPLPASAVIVTTDQVQAAGDRDKVRSFLDRAEVRAQLENLGVDANAARARVDALTDEEVSNLAARIDTLPAGGDSFLGILFAVFIILLITDILGLTKVFPFTRSVR
ncbi:MAG TPA: PA2779 family protein [Burkholderiales bacterium]|nr:PA2779 family protein [Burkholderiales bacterium]